MNDSFTSCRCCITSTAAVGWEGPGPADCTGWWWRSALVDWGGWRSVWWSLLGKTAPSHQWS